MKKAKKEKKKKKEMMELITHDRSRMSSNVFVGATQSRLTARYTLVYSTSNEQTMEN